MEMETKTEMEMETKMEMYTDRDKIENLFLVF